MAKRTLRVPVAALKAVRMFCVRTNDGNPCGAAAEIAPKKAPSDSINCPGCRRSLGPQKGDGSAPAVLAALARLQALDGENLKIELVIEVYDES
jgi:hypothetical protein